MGDNVERLASDPAGTAARIESQVRRLSGDAASSELVYSPGSQHSYYRDLISVQAGAGMESGAGDRLLHHAEQSANLEMRGATTLPRHNLAGVEYRVTPGRTDGQGGYFSPPAWLNELFATANRPGRVLAALMPKFPLPAGVSQVSVPIVQTGTNVQGQIDNAPATDQDLTDAAAESPVVPFAGQADVAGQLIDLSPHGASLDWAIFTDMSESYDYQLELQLLAGPTVPAVGTSALSQLTGVIPQAAVNLPYTSGSPTGAGLWTVLAQTAAQIGDGRLRPPECWLMRTARWFWIQGQEDSTNLPFGLSPIFIGHGDDRTPDPIGGVMGVPVFLNDAIPATQGAGRQDCIVALRPSDLVLLEGQPQTLIARDVLSGTGGVRLRMHIHTAAITGRRPAGIGVVSGTGMTVQTGY